MVAPIRPCDVKLIIPDFVIEAVNKLIQEKWDGTQSHIKQDEILARICSSDPDDCMPTRGEVFKKHWLDIENTYSEQGWDVEYEKSSYGDEPFDAYFVFKPKKNN